jgi:hypothetical protein
MLNAFALIATGVLGLDRHRHPGPGVAAGLVRAWLARMLIVSM